MDSAQRAPSPKSRPKPEWPRRIAASAGRRKVEVTVYRRSRPDGRIIFEVADYSDGRRRLRGFASEDEAVREATRIADHLARGEDFAAAFTAPDRASMGRALALLQSTGDALEVATARYAEAVALLGGPGKGGQLIEAVRYFTQHNPQNLPKVLVADAVDQFIESRRSLGKSPRYIDDLVSRLGRFKSDHVNIEIRTLTSQTLGDWLDGLPRLRGGRLTVQSRENFRRVIFGLCEFAVRKGWLVTNPVARVERHKVGERDVRIYTPDEFTALLQAATLDFLPFVVLGGFCGLRSAELERVDWHDVDLTAAHVVVGATVAKVKSRRVVPLPECAVRWLSRVANKEGPVWKGGHTGTRNAQEDTSKAAGVPWIKNGLRHSAASYLLAKHGDAGRVAGWLGNSADIVHKHYKSLVTPDVAARWFSIDPPQSSEVIPFPAAQDTDGPEPISAIPSNSPQTTVIH
ncbi:MAG: tyrosine recombinase XerC [Limisphaerales bacterium]